LFLALTDGYVAMGIRHILLVNFAGLCTDMNGERKHFQS
jgi:hypothetical protein